MLRRRESQHGDVLERLARRNQLFGKAQRAFDAPLGADHVAHGLVGFDPGPAGLAPTGAVEEPDIHAEPAALADGVLDHAPPFFGQGFHGAMLDFIEVDVADKGLADADALHGLEVLGDALA